MFILNGKYTYKAILKSIVFAGWKKAEKEFIRISTQSEMITTAGFFHI